MAPPRKTSIVASVADTEAIEARLDRIEKKLDALLVDAGLEVDAGPVCGHCGSADVVEDTCFGESPRVACRTCGKATTLASEQEAANG